MLEGYGYAKEIFSLCPLADIAELLDEGARRDRQTARAEGEKRLAADGSGAGDDGGTRGNAGNVESKIGAEARALAILVKHPEWNDTRIAKEAKVNRTQLYRYPRYQAARASVKDAGKADLPKGHKTQDGDLEAYE
jgi:hypothetical protein